MMTDVFKVAKVRFRDREMALAHGVCMMPGCDDAAEALLSCRGAHERYCGFCVGEAVVVVAAKEKNFAVSFDNNLGDA